MIILPGMFEDLVTWFSYHLDMTLNSISNFIRVDASLIVDGLSDNGSDGIHTPQVKIYYSRWMESECFTNIWGILTTWRVGSIKKNGVCYSHSWNPLLTVRR